MFYVSCGELCRYPVNPPPKDEKNCHYFSFGMPAVVTAPTEQGNVRHRSARAWKLPLCYKDDYHNDDGTMWMYLSLLTKSISLLAQLILVSNWCLHCLSDSKSGSSLNAD